MHSKADLRHIGEQAELLPITPTRGPPDWNDEPGLLPGYRRPGSTRARVPVRLAHQLVNNRADDTETPRRLQPGVWARSCPVLTALGSLEALSRSLFPCTHSGVTPSRRPGAPCASYLRGLASDP